MHFLLITYLKIYLKRFPNFFTMIKEVKDEYLFGKKYLMMFWIKK